MRIVLQPAFVLHRRPYRNTSLLLEALTPEQGRLGLVARGVRTARSRLKGLLQPFQRLLLSASGRGDLLGLTDAEEAGTPLLLPPSRWLSGLYVNELLLRLLQRQDPHPGVFVAYQTVLEALADTGNEEAALRLFEKRLLAGIGYGLALDAEIHTGAPIVPEGAYCYVLDQGPCPAGRSATGIPIAGKSLLALQQETLSDPDVLKEAKRLTRAAISVHLQGRPLKTRELLVALYQRRVGNGCHQGEIP
jgi:DNA repair protein RecO (recombination protein O)